VSFIVLPKPSATDDAAKIFQFIENTPTNVFSKIQLAQLWLGCYGSINLTVLNRDQTLSIIANMLTLRRNSERLYFESIYSESFTPNYFN
jgi:hypothetical protein